MKSLFHIFPIKSRLFPLNPVYSPALGILFDGFIKESIMEEINYPGLKEHKQKHELFVKEILKSVNAYKNGKQFVPNSFVRFLRDWLFNHILIDDKAWSLHYFSVKK